MLKNIKVILEEKNYKKFKIIVFLNSMVFFLELLSIASIPLFVTTLVNPSFVIEKASNFEFLNILKNYDKNELIFLTSIAMIGIFFMKNIFLMSIIYLQNVFTRDVKIALSLRLFKDYLNMSFLNHLSQNPADLTRNVTQHCTSVAVYINHFNSLIREITATIVIFFLVMWASPKIIIGVFIFFLITTLVYMTKIKPKIDKKSNKNNQIVRENIKTINEVFGSIKDIKIKMKESEIFNEFKKNIELFEKNIFFFQIFERIPRIVIEIFAVTTLSLIAIVLIGSNQDYQYFLPILSLITISIFRFIPAFVAINSANYFINILTPNLKTLALAISDAKLFDDNYQSKNTFVTLKNKKNLENKLISINNLSFSYPGSKATPLNNINFEVDEKKIIGITGESGSGKSTLFHLMLGLLHPTSGGIYNFGKNIHENIKLWRKKIGYISQNIFLFDNTIEKNITFNISDNEINRDKLEKVIYAAQLKDKILKLSDGLDTKVGNNGLKLSGGERQRIAISRALYQNPDILFLDESTSALDLSTEKLVMEQIIKEFKDKTIVLIAHRKSLLDYCDNIWTLEKGQLKKN